MLMKIVSRIKLDVILRSHVIACSRRNGINKPSSLEKCFLSKKKLDNLIKGEFHLRFIVIAETK